MGIQVLGPLTINGSPPMGRRDRVVIGSLATTPGQPVTTDRLVDALWGDTPPASAAKILQGCVVRLRKQLGQHAIETSPHGYVLRLPLDQIDSERFEHEVGRARELVALGEVDRVDYLLTNALGLWRGDPFEDLAGWEPAAASARRLGELRLEAEELRLAARLRAGRHRDVLALARSLVRAAPLREDRWSLLARAQYQSGQQGEALRTLHQLKAMLAGELGIDPGPDVVALEGLILRQDPSLVRSPPPPSSQPSCPWPGLKAYDVDDAELFFGRNTDVETCLGILRDHQVLALVGPSGCGKTSILQAGVVAALRGQGRTTLTITPGVHPLQSLTELGSAPSRAVLIVDQLEELFSCVRTPDERSAFLRALVSESVTRTMAVALRADRLADLAAHPGFSRLVERGLHLVGGLDDDGLRTSVETPARQAGLLLESGLVDLLVTEVGSDPGALPLLSHALLETWKRREGQVLTIDGYRASGGIHGAVAQSAEQLYAEIGPDRRPMLRNLVLRLVSPGVLGEPVRARLPRRQVSTDPDHEALVERLVAARLVTSDNGVLEITHEALARAWPRLRGWLEDDIEGQRMLHHLTSTADAWDTMARPDSELYRGVRLVRVLDWRRHSAIP